MKLVAFVLLFISSVSFGAHEEPMCVAVSIDGHKISHVLKFLQNYSHPDFPGGGSKVYSDISAYTITTDSIFGAISDQKIVVEGFRADADDAGLAVLFKFSNMNRTESVLKAQLEGKTKDIGYGRTVYFSETGEENRLSIDGQSMDARSIKMIYGPCFPVTFEEIAELERQL